MALSEEDKLLAAVERALLVGDRYFDCGLQLRVWKRGKGGVAVPGKLLPKVYGGRYDRFLRKYVGAPEHVDELSCHKGQLPLLLWDDPDKRWLMALGTPGVGKTYALLTKAALLIADRPNSNGGIVAPTGERRDIVWDEFLDIIGPLGWIDDMSTLKHRIWTKNGNIIDFVGAQRPSKKRGAPFQGKSWDWVVVDESQNVEDYAHTDIATRGRRAGLKFLVVESATNLSDRRFQERVKRYDDGKRHHVMRLVGKENPFVDEDWWSVLADSLDPRVYRQQVLLEDLPPEERIYPTFSWRETIRPRPEYGWQDVTPTITKEIFGKPSHYIIGQDFGVLVTYSVVLKCYREPNTGERIWWAIDEITSRNYTTADIHARRIKERYHESDCVVLADPHLNSKEVDASDYNLFRKEGFTIKPAIGGRIKIRHRLSMMNCLLEDASGVMPGMPGKRRFFIDCSHDRKPACPLLATAFHSMEVPDSGVLEAYRKDKHDQTHYPAAVAYGLYRWEKIRGISTFEAVTGEQPDSEKKLWRHGPKRRIR